DSGSNLVLVEPNLAALLAMMPDVFQAGNIGNNALTAACSLPLAQRAELLSGGGQSYRSDNPNVVSCFAGVAGDSFGLLQLNENGRTITIVANSLWFSNEHIIQYGNAAMALGVLGATEELIWYLPGLSDAAEAIVDTATLVPGWLTPLVLLCFAVVIAAALW